MKSAKLSKKAFFYIGAIFLVGALISPLYSEEAPLVTEALGPETSTRELKPLFRIEAVEEPTSQVLEKVQAEVQDKAIELTYEPLTEDGVGKNKVVGFETPIIKIELVMNFEY